MTKISPCCTAGGDEKNHIQFVNSFCFFSCLLDRGHINIDMRICFAYKQNEDNVGIMDIAVVQRDDDYETEDKRVTIGEFIETLSPCKLPTEYIEMPDNEAFSLVVRETYADNMLCALGKGDSEWLYGQFRNSMKNDELIAKISDVFQFVGGSGTGYSSVNNDFATKRVNYGTIEQMTDKMIIYDVIGGDGNVYQIEYEITYFDDDAEKIGISCFMVSRVGGYDSSFNHIILDRINIGGKL